MKVENHRDYTEMAVKVFEKYKGAHVNPGVAKALVDGPHSGDAILI